MLHLVIVVYVCIFGLVRLVCWLLRPLEMHCIRKRGATNLVRSFSIPSLGLFTPPPPNSPFLGTPRGPAVT